jgi:hypothetical protein
MPEAVNVWKIILIVVLWLVLLPIGDAVNRSIRSGGNRCGGFTTDRVIDWLRSLKHRKK